MKSIISLLISVTTIICFSAEDNLLQRGIIHYPQLITFAHENGAMQETFDLLRDDTTVMESFSDIIRERQEKGRASIIARLLTTTGTNTTISYFDVNHLHRWWFDKCLYPNDDELDMQEQDRHFVAVRFPHFKINQENTLETRGEIPYFIAKHGGSDTEDTTSTINLRYIGSSYDVINNDTSGRYLRALLMAHYANNNEVEVDAQRNAWFFLTGVYKGHEKIPGVAIDKQLAAYYERKINEDMARADPVANVSSIAHITATAKTIFNYLRDR